MKVLCKWCVKFMMLLILIYKGRFKCKGDNNNLRNFKFYLRNRWNIINRSDIFLGDILLIV